MGRWIDAEHVEGIFSHCIKHTSNEEVARIVEWCLNIVENAPAITSPTELMNEFVENTVDELDEECEYCSGSPMLPLNWKYGLDYILPDYKYCPMCGRKVIE